MRDCTGSCLLPAEPARSRTTTTTRAVETHRPDALRARTEHTAPPTPPAARGGGRARWLANAPGTKQSLVGIHGMSQGGKSTETLQCMHKPWHRAAAAHHVSVPRIAQGKAHGRRSYCSKRACLQWGGKCVLGLQRPTPSAWLLFPGGGGMAARPARGHQPSAAWHYMPFDTNGSHHMMQ